ncbi:MAG: F0F1 ATP synthase subunit epsilon [Sporomusaceae bacterium]|nr:F0F1 ATP synthase subunit epsilon [Sporomusaceae bacterium]
MANKIRLDIVTPERITYSEDVNMLIARATDGDIGILPGHAPLIAALDIWPIRILQDEGESKMAVAGGFLEVRPHKITILANSAESIAEIDVERALEAKGRAENRLKGGDYEHLDTERAQLALKRATMRLRTAGKI